MAISRWSAAVLDYLYGLPSAASLATFDDALFVPPVGGSTESTGPYLAVPTAALDERSGPLVARLALDGVPIRTYGPQPLPGVPHAGFLPDSEMVRFLAGARGTVFLFDYEALGLIPIESLAVGTPVITWPREGPALEHEGNPHVRFVTGYTELLAAARSLASSPKTPEVIAGCRASIERYRPAIVAGRLIQVIAEARAASVR